MVDNAMNSTRVAVVMIIPLKDPSLGDYCIISISVNQEKEK
ncbi:hypothetical protein SDC9_101892 [bioreactor metagenome]|uniref:Uncharacterized protein n=1 Tax=bioreactor metagenome TaxID=1076179 RepID=A0A645APX4_9ZZZZ